MRKFHYLVTIDVDDEHLEQMVKDQPDLLEGEAFEGVSPENFISIFAQRMTEGIDEALQEGLGDAGNSKVKTAFAGECK
ncbi:hypothetical protein EXT67_21150 [Pectobacterium atrosepticum]|uniref:hypothetical protein n=1 Tax=Pectobacterium atrosepticum TaxID=29471 RepID=UPI00203170CC|nr:hypothetical protein [Pectobacterium atrosepticum]MCL6318804.1 hypothetical protein [Pectobacterium atrosepticum]